MAVFVHLEDVSRNEKTLVNVNHIALISPTADRPGYATIYVVAGGKRTELLVKYTGPLSHILTKNPLLAIDESTVQSKLNPHP